MPAEKRKALFLLDTVAEMGGAEALAVELAIRLDPERFERYFVLTRWDDAALEAGPGRAVLARLSEAGVRVSGLKRSRRLALRPWINLVRLLRRERVDIVHAHKFGSNLWAVLFGRLARVPVVVAHEHMWSYSERSPRNLVDRDVIARFADAFIAVSDEGRRQMIELQGIPAEDVIYIPNGIPELPPGDRDTAREALGIAPGAPVVGTLANLRPEKALEVLIEAAAILREEFAELRVVVAGEGEERALLERLIADRDLKDKVLLLGWRDDRADLLAAFDLAVCCSDFEGGPLSVMEYMDVGLPIVATRVGGLPELLGEGDCGLLVEPRDPAALAAALAALIRDPERRETLGASARALRERRYGIDTWVRRIEALYADLLAARDSQTPT